MKCFHFKLKLTNWIFPVCSTTLIFCFHRVKGIEMLMSAWGTALVSGVNRRLLTEQLEGILLFIALHNINFFTMLCCGTFTLRRYFLTCAILIRRLSPPEREQTHGHCEELRKRDVPLTPMMKALIQMEDTKATEGRVLSKNGCSSSSMSPNAP